MKRDVLFTFADVTSFGTPLPSRLAYSAHDPLYMSITFKPKDSSRVTWVFSRQLMLDGIESTTPNDGFIRIYRGSEEQSDSANVYVELIAHDHPSKNIDPWSALVTCPYADLRSFKEDMLRILPSGHEYDHVDVDRTIGRILLGK